MAEGSDTESQLSEWLELMLAEIARKREEARRASEERAQRELGNEAPR